MGPWGYQPLGLKKITVGQESNDQPRIQITSVSLTPAVSRPGAQQERDVEVLVQNDAFPCDVCKRSFSTKTGLGVHMSRMHKDRFDELRLRVDVKARWNEEEMTMIARKELEITAKGERFINKRLAEVYTHRSVESIKKTRQRDAYKAKIEQLRSEVTRIPEAINEPPTISPRLSYGEPGTSSRSRPPPIEPLVHSDMVLLRILQGLPPVECSQSWRVEVLQSIVDRAQVSGKEATLQCLSNYLLEIFPNRNIRPVPASASFRPQARNRRQNRRQQYAKADASHPCWKDLTSR